MFSWFRRRPKFYAPQITLEQLEERIVMDACVDQPADNNAAAEDPMAAHEPAAEPSPESSAAADLSGSSQSENLDVQVFDSNPAQILLSNTDLESVLSAVQDADDPGHDVRVLLISSAVSGADQLAAAAGENVITIQYDASTDTPTTILTALESALEGEKADSIGFAIHDLGEAQFQITPSSTVNPIRVLCDPEIRFFWQEVGALTEGDGRIDIFACNLASTDAGTLLVSQLEALSGRNVAASDDPTGNEEAGGDWILETDNVDLRPIYFKQDSLRQYDHVFNEIPWDAFVKDALFGTQDDDYMRFCDCEYQYVYGLSGDDTIEITLSERGYVDDFVKSPYTQIHGGDGNDNIVNSGGVRYIYGDAGDDTIENHGNVCAYYDWASDYFIDEVFNHDDRLEGPVWRGPAGIFGGDGNDFIATDDFSHNSDIGYHELGMAWRISGDAGHDTIEVYGWVARGIEGGSGNDHITTFATSEAWRDVLGGSGDDTITIAGLVRDDVRGDDGNDVIVIEGNCSLVENNVRGGSGNDSISNFHIVEGKICGDDGDDEITNGEHGRVDDIFGGDGSDTIVNCGLVGDDIRGGAGNDTISLRPGSTVDQVYGEDGDDAVWVYGGEGVVHMDGGAGTDKLFLVSLGGVLNITGTAESGQCLFVGTGTAPPETFTWSNFESVAVIGSGGADFIGIAPGAEVSSIACMGGDDLVKNFGKVGYIYGNDGVDTINIYGGARVEGGVYGGSGVDTINIYGEARVEGDVDGGPGDDTISIYHRAEVEGDVDGGSGEDHIRSSGTVSRWITGGPGNDSITNEGIVYSGIDAGSGDDSVRNTLPAGTWCIEGGDGSDDIENRGIVEEQIDGGTGDDYLVNFFLVDRVLGGNGNDTIENRGYVLARTDGGASDGGASDGGTSEGGAIDGGTSNGGAIDGGAIVGGQGNDTIKNYAGARADKLSGGDGVDLIENMDGGTVTGDISGGDQDDTLINGGEVLGNVLGNGGSDRIVNSGDVSGILDGGAGNDRVENIIFFYLTGNTAGIKGGDGNDFIFNEGIVNGNIQAGTGYDLVSIEGGAITGSSVAWPVVDGGSGGDETTGDVLLLSSSCTDIRKSNEDPEAGLFTLDGRIVLWTEFEDVPATVPTNNAPVMDADAALSFTSLREDWIPNWNRGDSVKEILSSASGDVITDADPGALEGIAITGVESYSHGRWQYQLEGESLWRPLNDPAADTALLLSETARVRFLAYGHYNHLQDPGNIPMITFLAWDQTSGTAGETADITVRGGVSAFSVQEQAADILVTPVNDAPFVLNPGHQWIDEDQPLIISGISVFDQDVNETPAPNNVLECHLAVNHGEITLSSSSGLTFLEGDGTGDTSMTFVGTLDNMNAALNDLKYTSDHDYWGQDGLVITVDDLGHTGSEALTYTRTVSIYVQPVDDAPELDPAGTPKLPDIWEDIPLDANPAATVADILAGARVMEPDNDPLGMAIVGVDETNGSWHYSTNAGADWNSLSMVSDGNALLLAADNPDNLIRFLPNPNYNGSATFTFRAWDQTDGADGDTANISVTGGDTAFSEQTDQASVRIYPINDLPVAKNVTSSGDEDTVFLLGTEAAWNTAFEDLVDSGDGKHGVPSSLVITDTSNLHGSLYIGNTEIAADMEIPWLFVHFLTYEGDSDFNGTGSFDFRVRDGARAQSDNEATMTITVNPVNDAPTSSGVPDPPSVRQGFGTQTYDVSGYFSDVDGPALTYELGTVTYDNGLRQTDVTIDPGSGVITFTNDTHAWGSVEAQVRANDGSLCCDWQTFTFTVNRVNGPQPPPVSQLDPTWHLEWRDDSGLDTPLFSRSGGWAFPYGWYYLLSGLPEAFWSPELVKPKPDALADDDGGLPKSDDHDGLPKSDDYDGYPNSKEKLPESQPESKPYEGQSEPGEEQFSKDQDDTAPLSNTPKERTPAEQLEDLEDFLDPQHKPVNDTDDSVPKDRVLVFNADEINLIKLLDSDTTSIDWLKHDDATRIIGPHRWRGLWPQGKTLIFDLDNIKTADIFEFGSDCGPNDRLMGHSPKPNQAITRVFDLNEVSLLDALAM